MPDPGRWGLGDAVTEFLTNHPPKDVAGSQQVLQRFVRWCGRERPVSGLSPWEIENFGQNSGADSLAKLAPIKAFLAYAHKEGMTSTNLGAHLKVKRAPIRHRQAKRSQAAPTARLSAEGFQKAQQELEVLKVERVSVTEDIKRAMADKDFRENAPLDAARDKQAHIEARIRELERTLHTVEIIEDPGRGNEKGRCRIGSRVIVQDLDAKVTYSYILVDPQEVDLGNNKISVDSPVGKAFLNKCAGEVIDVKVPAGRHRYRIEGVDGLTQ